MKAYKGFDKDLKCRGIQYEVGKEYEEANAALCKKGFHACENPLDTFRYYRPTDSRYCEVDVDDNGERNSTDSKVCGKHIKISAEIGLKGVINAGVRFVFDKCESATEENASGERGNAAGRMRMDENDENASPSGGHAAVELLIEGNESIAAEFGNVIDAYNQDRKSIDRSVTQEAHDYIEGNPEMKALKSTVIYNPRWMKGIVGIVASRLIETYYRPTVVLTMSNGFVTGSARSVPGFDLYQAVESCSDLLENFGGHMYAAGLTMRPENVGEFTRRFNAYVEENIDPQMLVPQVDIDSELLFSDITPAFRKDLNRFQPFGPGNTAPVFATCGVSNHGDAKLVGMECEHLRMDLMQRQKPNTKIQAIAFQQPTHYEWVRSGRPIDVCYQIVENHYRGTVTTQLRIKDIKPVLNR